MSASGPPARIADRYRTLATLGRGGVCTVLRVFDEKLWRELALKQLVIADHANSARIIDMFSLEFRTLSQLSHPSVVRVFDYGTTASGPYYTMELLEGSDMYALSPLGWREACRYLRDVSSCLALLHSRHLIHRDVTPRNIRCHAGRAMLFDFGAMAPMGPVRFAVGTPPMMAPELLERQALDGRYDLYALGATLYWVLTGRHAYPAHVVSELHDVWRSPPAPPSHYTPDIPEALDKLVLSLLAQSVDARPRSAAEVMEALSSIAGLAPDEQLHVPLSYLTAPALIGRDAELAQVRDALIRANEASSVLWITGEPGVGRSRLLDAATVEARLAGARVARADAHVALSSLADLAHALLPQLENAGATTPHELASTAVRTAAAQGERAYLTQQLQELMQQRCAERTLLVVVDDVTQLESAAQTLLSILLAGTPRGLLLVLATTARSEVHDSLAGAPRAHEIALSRLTETQIESLLRSIFGDVPGVSSVAARIQRLAQGSPRDSMSLAQHLVDTGRARYALGGWVLPAELEQGDLPASWTVALDERIAALPPHARELAEALAFAEPYDFGQAELPTLLSERSYAELMSALDALLALGVCRLEGDLCLFTRIAYAERLRAACLAERARLLNERLADALRATHADPIAVAECLLAAERAGQAIDTLLDNIRDGTRWDTAPANYGSVLERAADACIALGRPRRDRFNLLYELIQVGAHLGVPHMRERFLELAEQLKEDSPLGMWLRLPDDLPAAERLQQAFRDSFARYEQLPEQERVLAPIEAIKALTLLTRHAYAFASVAMDGVLLDRLPSLLPLESLSPAIALSMHSTGPAARHLIAARYEDARNAFMQAAARLEQPDRCGLDEQQHRWASTALLFALGHLNAGIGKVEALQFAERLELVPEWVMGAWDVRHAYYQRFGDWIEAEKCRRQLEWLRVQATRRPLMVDTSARLELDNAAHTGDLTLAQRAAERLRSLVKLHPGYAPYEHYVPALLALIRGQHEQALIHAQAALSMIVAGGHPSWPWAVHCELWALLGLGRVEEARQRGLQRLADAGAAQIVLMSHHAVVPLALAEARLGMFESAVARVEACIEYRTALGCRGINLGWVYEARARIAIWMGDRAAYEKAAARCGEEYGEDRKGSSLAAKYEVLKNEARQAKLDVGDPVRTDAPETDCAATAVRFAIRTVTT